MITIFSKQKLPFLFITLFSTFAYAQQSDSLSITIGTTATVAQKDFQPLWMLSNKFGAFADRRNDLTSMLHGRYRYNFKNRRLANRTVGSDSIYQRPFYSEAGINLINNNSFQQVFLNEGYLRIGYGGFDVRAGQYQQIIGEVDKDLSSGSLAISGNARPIPMVTLAASDYLNVPFTNGWLQIKGSFSHGWFGNNRYMQDAWLHEKTFYMRLGKNKWKVFGGVVHDVEWAGRRGDMQLERSWKGFFDVLTVKEADDGSVGGNILPNRPGDQRGILDLGASFASKKMIYQFYHQTPFESGQGIEARNIDRLTGLVVENKQTSKFFKKWLIEFIHTKQMENYYPSQFAQIYYNNGFYKTGWEYENRIVGTPLFVNRHRAQHYFPDIKPYDWQNQSANIPGNSNILFVRLIGGHTGVIFNLLQTQSLTVESKTLLTFTQSYNTRSDDSSFKQCYAMQEVLLKSRKLPITLLLGFGIDNGQFSNNVGGLVGITWQIIEN